MPSSDETIEGKSFGDAFKYRLLKFLSQWRFGDSHVQSIETAVHTIVDAKLHEQRDEFMNEIRTIEKSIAKIESGLKVLLIVATILVPVFTSIISIVLTKALP